MLRDATTVYLLRTWFLGVRNKHIPRIRRYLVGEAGGGVREQEERLCVC